MALNGGHTPWTVTSGNGYSATAPADAYVLLKPKTRPNGRLILWHHGAGGETVFLLPAWKTAATPATGNVRTNLHEKILTPLIDRGYTILGADFANFAGPGGLQGSFANDQNLARIGDAITWAAGLGLSTARVGLLGESMGSMSTFVWASRNPALVACLCTYMTAGDTDDVYARSAGGDPNVAGLAAKMDAAYAGPFTPTGGYTASAASRNPASSAVWGAVKAAGLAPYWRAYYASDDPIALPASVTTLAANLGVADHAMNLGAGGHTDDPLANIDPADLARFVEAGRWA